MGVELVSDKEKLFSVTELAEMFHVSRRFAADRIANIPHVQKVGASRLWRLYDVSYTLSPKPEDHFEGKDPDELPPGDRDKWYSSEQRRVKLLAEAKSLLPVSQVEEGLSEVFKALQLTIATLPDIMERDCLLSPNQVKIALNVCDRSLAQLNKSLLDLTFNE